MHAFDLIYVAITGVWNAWRMMVKVIDAGSDRGILADSFLAAAYAALALWSGLMLFGL